GGRALTIINRGAELLAIFSYASVLDYRTIPRGPRNSIVGGRVESQDYLFENGGPHIGARVAFQYGDTVSWTLEGATSVVNANTTRCTGRELLEVPGLENAQIFAQNSLLFQNNADIRPLALTGGRFELAANAKASSAFAGGPVFLRSNAYVSGDLVTAGDIDFQHGASIAGVQSEGAYVPNHNIAFQVDFPAAINGNLFLEPGQAAFSASPGSYGQVSVKSDAQLILRSGVYYFESF